MTVGMPLSAYASNLTHVPAEHAVKPSASFDAVGRMGDKVRDYLVAYHGEDYDLDGIFHNLPYAALRNLSSDETAKLMFSSTSWIGGGFREKLEADPTVHLASLIKSSAWRWGMNDVDWNEVVDAYEGIRSFDLGVSGLEVTLDHLWTNGPFGTGQHCRSWIDGVFAYLVHHKGEPVMKIAFSVIGGRGILVQQVQLFRKTGNRWLFRFPANRVEHVVDRFRAAFPRHTVHLVDGADVAKVNLERYRDGVASTRRSIADYRAKLERRPGDEHYTEMLEEAIEHLAKLKRKISHIQGDAPRIAAFYGDVGHHALGEPVELKGMRHYAIAA